MVSVEIGLSWSRSILVIVLMVGEGAGGLIGDNSVLITVQLDVSCYSG